MNSAKILNYETRPCKFVERLMILETFQRICNMFSEPYQYIGLGGIAFTDFKLFHSGLHISDMHSIEGGKISAERLEYNKPYSFIKIHKEFTTSALSKIDLNKKSIVWLDYDDTLNLSMFEDLQIVIDKLPVGSLFIVSCNRELKNGDDAYSIDTFREKFRELVPFEIKDKDLIGRKHEGIIFKMFNTALNNIIDNRRISGEEILFQQLYNITYQENRGAQMYTYGGIILDNVTEVNKGLSHLSYISQGESFYNIDLPNITYKEELLINRYMNIIDSKYPKELEKIVSDSDYKKYIRHYKHYPNFIDVKF